MSHEVVEKNIGLMVVLIIIVISFGGLAEIVPLYFTKDTTQPVEGLTAIFRMQHQPTVA